MNKNIENHVDLLDCIREYTINVSGDTSKEEIENILNNSIIYLDQKLEIDVANELFILILKCFSKYPNELQSIFNQIFDKSKKNANYIIITASVISYLIQNDFISSDSEYYTFVDDIIKDILHHCSFTNEKQLLLHNHEIPYQFELSLMLDVLLSTKITDEIIKIFIPNIFSLKNQKIYSSNKEKLSQFVHKIIQLGFVNLIVDFLPDCNDFFSIINNDDFEVLIKNLSDQKFIQIFPKIEYCLINSAEESFSLSFIFLQKCKALNLKLQLKSIEKIFNSLPINCFTPEILEYFKSYDYVFEIKNDQIFDEFPDPLFLVKVTKNLEILPKELFTKGLLEITDYHFYNRIFSSILSFLDIPTTSDFYVHVYSVINNQCTDKFLKCEMLQEFSKNFFGIYVKIEKSNSVIDDIIFSINLSNENEIKSLVTFINSLNFEIFNKFFDETHMINLLDKIIEKNIVPHYFFMSLFDSSMVNQILKNSLLKSNPKKVSFLHYALTFSNEKKKILPSFSILKIEPKIDVNNVYLSNFINKNELDLMTKLDDKSLLLASNALIFAAYNHKKKIVGLNKETILPFYSIAIRNWVNKFDSILFESKDINDLFLQSFLSMINNKSPVITASINSILIGESKNIIPNFKSIKDKILINLYESIMKGDYYADKTVLFSYIIMNINSLKIIKKDLNDFIPLIVKHLPEIDYKSIQHKLNLNNFNSQRISIFISDIIENSKSQDELINILYFILNMCTNVPKLKISHFDNIVKIISEEKSMENISFICSSLSNLGYMNEMQNLTLIPVEIHNLINSISAKNKEETQSSSDLLNDITEIDDKYLKKLFKKMSSNKSINEEYYDILIQSLTNENNIEPEKIYSQYSKVYLRDPEQFCNSVNKIYYLNDNFGQKKIFIKRAKITKNDLVFSKFEIELSMIKEFIFIAKNKLNCYQAFLCLNSIARSFPFLFEQEPDLIFDLVLPKLDDFSILFDKNIDISEIEMKNKAKTAIASFSFLISILHSTKIIDCFINWYFNHIDIFNDIQIFCFNFIFQSILKDFGMRHVLMSSLLNFNFIDILKKFYNRKVPEGSFHDNYINMIYAVLLSYYQSVVTLSPIDVITTDELRKVKTPFMTNFGNNLTIYPLTIDQISEKSFENVPQTDLNNELFKFMENINKPRSFWLNTIIKSKTDQEIPKSLISKFLQKYNQIIPHNNNKIMATRRSKIHLSISVKMSRYLLHQPKWLLDWIINDKRFSIYSEHNSILDNAIQSMLQMENDADENENLNEFDTEKYFIGQYEHKDLFENLANNIFLPSLNGIIFFKLNFLIHYISRNGDTLNIILNVMSKKLDFIKEMSENGENVFNLIDNFISVFSPISYSYKFKQLFQDICEKAINIFLMPQNRSNEKMLNILYDFLYRNDFKVNEVPNSIKYFASFMILSKKEQLIMNAFKLLSKYNIKMHDLEKFKIIKTLFQDEIKKKEPSISIISEIVNIIETIDKSNYHEIINLTKKLFIQNNSENKNEKIINNLINKLLNLLTPNRNMNEPFVLVDLPDQHKNSLQPIPKFIYDSNPIFWEFFEQNRTNINNIIEKQELEFSFEKENEEEEEEEEDKNENKKSEVKLKLLNEYPELFSFDVRYKLFQQKMHRRINHIYELSLLIDKDKILESSFNQLCDRNPSQWKRNIRIEYINEIGTDLSGLRRDWFIYLSRELFDPNKGLFTSNNNVSFQPSRLSYAIPEFLKFFKFAGMIVARALLQGENLDVHLSRPFLKQILHHKVFLKDIEDSDENIFNSLQYILDNDVEKDQYNEYYFDVDKDDYGVLNTYELIENGSETKVTNENKSEFVDLMINYHSKESIDKQIQAFCDGFYSIIKHNDIKIFTSFELDLLICGIPEINVDDLMKNAECVFPLTKKTPHVKLFFDSIAKWGNADLAKLLMFITGSPKVPGNGFRKIKIQPGGNKNRLPVAHTCFNTLDLPEYQTENELNAKFMLAINEKSFQLS